jgi:Prokaryotic dksA/traR C4-type zinc finger
MNCVSCGEPIPEERLAVKPDADRCIEHQSIDDRRDRHHPDDPRGSGFPPAPNLYDSD